MSEKSFMRPQLHNHLPEELVRQLSSFRNRLWFMRLLELFCACISLLCFAFIIFYGIERVWETPNILRQFIFLAPVTSTLVMIPYWLWRWLWQRRTLPQLARLIAKKQPNLGDNLLGIIELDDENVELNHSSPRLRQAAMGQIAAETSKVDLMTTLHRPSPRGFIITATLLLMIAGGLYFISTHAWVSTLLRLALPHENIPRYTFTQLDIARESTLPTPRGEQLSYPIWLLQSSSFMPDTISYKLDDGAWQVAELTTDLPTHTTPPKANLPKLSYFDRKMQATVQRSPLPTCVTRPHGYWIRIPGLQETATLQIRAGDAYHTIHVTPEYRPALQQASASVTYPEHLGLPIAQVPMRAGVFNLLQESTAQIVFTPTKALAQASITIQTTGGQVTTEQLSLNTADGTATTTSFAVIAKATELSISMTDHHGLTNTQPIKLRIEPFQDTPPQVQLRCTRPVQFVLENTPVEFEATAQDDFGLQELSIEWATYQRAINEEEEDTVEPIATRQLKKGSFAAESLQSSFVFQANELGIAPQEIVIRAYTQDYHPFSDRIYSAPPLILQILGPTEHAQAIRELMDRTISQLEELARKMDTIGDLAYKLQKQSKESLLNDEESAILEQLKANEQLARQELTNLTTQSQDIFQEATRNPEIDKNAMKNFMHGVQMLRPLPKGLMSKAEQQFSRAAQAELADPAAEALEEAAKANTDATDELRKAIATMASATQSMEATTFAARLQQAARQESTVGNNLVNALTLLIGKTPTDLAPTALNQLKAIEAAQENSSTSIAWIIEDLGYFKSKSSRPIYGEIHQEMIEIDLVAKLNGLQENLTNARAALALESAFEYSSLLADWAKRLDDFSKKQGGGGGGGGEEEGMSDEDFEIMLRIIQLMQAESDIRTRTRNIETNKRHEMQ